MDPVLRMLVWQANVSGTLASDYETKQPEQHRKMSPIAGLSVEQLKALKIAWEAQEDESLP